MGAILAPFLVALLLAALFARKDEEYQEAETEQEKWSAFGCMLVLFVSFVFFMGLAMMGIGIGIKG
jgi:hypothetical protein